MGVIKVQKSFDAAAHGREQRKLDIAKKETFEAMKELREERRAMGITKKQGRIGGIHYSALMNAVEQEGPEVLSAAGQDYFDHEARINPWITIDGKSPNTDSPNGHKTRFGKVKEKMIGGKWYHWDEKAGGWVEGEITKRKGVA